MTKSKIKSPKTSKIVVNCYNILDNIFPLCGLNDFTDGIYNNDPKTSYEKAQSNQLNWLLDRVECKEGTTILDIGCGNGTLLKEAKKRGAKAIGITVSPKQFERCRKNGLEVYLLDYKNIDDSWNKKFDCVIANGSMEHFVHPRDEINGKTDEIYKNFFKICHRVINPRSNSKKIATTVIHYSAYHPKPENLLKSPLSFKLFSSDFHAAILEKTMGGWYPRFKQLEQNAKPYFKLINETDGTFDYYLTSEEWLHRAKKGFLSLKIAPKILIKLFPFLIRYPKQSVTTLFLLFAESWQWQFRGENPPTKLLRQVWDYQD